MAQIGGINMWKIDCPCSVSQSVDVVFLAELMWCFSERNVVFLGEPFNSNQTSGTILIKRTAF